MKEILLQAVTTQDDKDLFIKEIQKAFQDAFEREYGKFGKTILPTSDIEESFNGEGAQILFAFDNAKRVGGVVVAIDPKTQNNSLDLLYVKDDSQNSGYGIKIWKAIEQQYPNTKVGRLILRILIKEIYIFISTNVVLKSLNFSIQNIEILINQVKVQATFLQIRTIFLDLKNKCIKRSSLIISNSDYYLSNKALIRYQTTVFPATNQMLKRDSK